MNLFKKIGIFAIVSSCFLPQIANATNGFSLIGAGSKARGMGGVAIAYPQDSISASANPALTHEVKNRIDIGGDLFIPSADASLGDLDNVESHAGLFGLEDIFIMPYMGFTYELSSDMSVGVNMVPGGGGASDYDLNLYNSTSSARSVTEPLGVNVMIGQINTSLAYAMNKKNTIGASLVVNITRFELKGVGIFDTFTQTQTPDNLTDQGYDWSVGAGIRIGWLGKFLSDNLFLGAVYQSKIYTQKFNRYTEALPEDGSMDMPANIGLGISYKLIPKLVVGLDITHTFYEDVAAFANRGPNISGPPLGSEDRRLGLPNGMSFGWQDQTVYKIGADYSLNESWNLRAGWNYGETPIDERTEIIFNILAPATTQNHLTLGATYHLDKKAELNFSYVHAYRFTQFGPTYIGNEGEFSMSQDSFGVGYSYSY